MDMGTREDRARWRRQEAEERLQRWERQEAWRNLVYAFTKGMGVIWIIKHIPSLRLKHQWMQDRDDGTIPHDL